LVLRLVKLRVELAQELAGILNRETYGDLGPAEPALVGELPEGRLHLVEHRRVQAAGGPGGGELGRDPDRLGRGAVGLLAPLPARGALDPARPVTHANMEVEVTRIDAETLRELPVRQRLRSRAEFLEHAQAQGVTERLELVGTIDRQRFEHVPISSRSLG